MTISLVHDWFVNLQLSHQCLITVMSEATMYMHALVFPEIFPPCQQAIAHSVNYLVGYCSLREPVNLYSASDGDFPSKLVPPGRRELFHLMCMQYYQQDVVFSCTLLLLKLQTIV